MANRLPTLSPRALSGARVGLPGAFAEGEGPGTRYGFKLSGEIEDVFVVQGFRDFANIKSRGREQLFGVIDTCFDEDP